MTEMTAETERAMRIVEERKKAAEAAADFRRRSLENISPELKEINRKIAEAGIKAVRAIGKGGNASAYIKRLAKENLENQQKQAEILRELGLEADALEPHYECKKCGDTGSIDGHICECVSDLAAKLGFEKLCSAAPAKECTFESFSLDYYKGLKIGDTELSAYERMSQILNYCRSYADDFGKSSPSILMYGATGLGKTHLSLAIANRVVDKGFNVVYASAVSLFRRLEKEHFGKGRGEEDSEEGIVSCDLLILDDLGSEFFTSFTLSELYNIINSRILAGLPTIVNTNLRPDEIEEKYSPRICSRILGDYTPLEFAGSDVRQLKADE